VCHMLHRYDARGGMSSDQLNTSNKQQEAPLSTTVASGEESLLTSEQAGRGWWKE